MIQSDIDDTVQLLHLHFLEREPSSEEKTRWTGVLARGAPFNQVLNAFLRHPAYLARTRVKTQWPYGNFYSPIVDPETVRDYVEKGLKLSPGEIAAINLPVDEMVMFWNNHKDFIARTPFTFDKNETSRYYSSDSPYPLGDAVTLRAMINAYRPRKIIEVGCGFSSACILDTVDEIGLSPFQLTCIEPLPAALKKRLSDADIDKIRLIESGVQDVPVDVFEDLDRNDVLFIDSTHVLKTGSDVHYEFFYILPKLKSGVLIHFHDCRYPFEYPTPFIFERNYSWNEVYALRAFLMYNSKFKVIFYNSLLAREHLSRPGDIPRLSQKPRQLNLASGAITFVTARPGASAHTRR